MMPEDFDFSTLFPNGPVSLTAELLSRYEEPTERPGYWGENSLKTLNSSLFQRNSSSKGGGRVSTWHSNTSANEKAYWEYDVSLYLMIIGGPIVFALGMIGNILTLLVLKGPHFRNISITIYFAALAVADIGVLAIGLSRHWVKATYELDARLSHPILCKLQPFLTYTLLDTASWTMVLITVERYIGICKPLALKISCTRLKAVQYLALTVGLVIGKNLPIFFTFGSYDMLAPLNSTFNGTMSQRVYCGFLNDDVRFYHTTILPWFASAVYFFGPFLIMTVLNALTARKLRSLGHLKKSAISVTNMFLASSWVFLIMTCPSFLNFVAEKYYFNASEADGEAIAVHRLIQQSLLFLLYANHSINFVIFVTMGEKFRHELLVLLSKNRCSSFMCCVTVEYDNAPLHIPFDSRAKISICGRSANQESFKLIRLNSKGQLYKQRHLRKEIMENKSLLKTGPSLSLQHFAIKNTETDRTSVSRSLNCDSHV